MKRWLASDVAAIIAVTAIIFLFFFRLFFPTPQLIITPDFGQSDAVASFSTKYFLGVELQKHHIPLWSTHMGGGYPIYAHGSMGTFFIPNFILFSFFSPVYAYTLALFLAVSITGWGMYVWLRQLQNGRLPSVFGALTLALSGYIISQFTHITIVQNISLLPALAATTYALAYKKSWKCSILLCILLSQQILIGFPQSVFISMLFLVGYFCFLIRKSQSKAFDIVQFIVAYLGSLALSAIQILPSMEYASTLVSSSGFPPSTATVFSFPLAHLKTLIYPFALGNPATGTYPHFLAFDGSIFWENITYIGIVPLVCLFLWILFYRRLLKSKKQTFSILFFSILLATSLLFALGRHSPIYFIFSLWPFNLFRVPSRFIWLFQIALVVLSTHAFGQILGYIKQKRLAELVGVLAIVLQVFTIFFIWSPYHNLEPANAWLETPSLVQYLNPSQVTLTIGGERLHNNTYANGWSTENPSDRPSYILRNTFTADKNLLWNVTNIREYAGRDIKRSKVLNDILDQTITTDASHATISAFGMKLITTLSIGNIISTLPLTQEGLLSKAELTDPTHMVRLYTNPEALPRIYAATKTIPVKTVENALEVLASDAFVPGHTVLVENGQAFSSEENNTVVKVNNVQNGTYTLTAEALEEHAMIVIAETYYPGWKATVDGKETSVIPVNIRHLGIPITKGSHEVVVEYAPESFTKGAWISAISHIVIVFLVVFVFLLGI